MENIDYINFVERMGSFDMEENLSLEYENSIKMYEDSLSEFQHHGIKGQKWGDTNLPYGIPNNVSAAEYEAIWHEDVRDKEKYPEVVEALKKYEDSVMEYMRCLEIEASTTFWTVPDAEDKLNEYVFETVEERREGKIEHSDLYLASLSEFQHHGIKGQKWGVCNGPPYPLNPNDYSHEEKELNKVNKYKSRTRKDTIKYISEEFLGCSALLASTAVIMTGLSTPLAAVTAAVGGGMRAKAYFTKKQIKDDKTLVQVAEENLKSAYEKRADIIDTKSDDEIRSIIPYDIYSYYVGKMSRFNETSKKDMEELSTLFSKLILKEMHVDSDLSRISKLNSIIDEDIKKFKKYGDEPQYGVKDPNDRSSSLMKEIKDSGTVLSSKYRRFSLSSADSSKLSSICNELLTDNKKNELLYCFKRNISADATVDDKRKYYLSMSWAADALASKFEGVSPYVFQDAINAYCQDLVLSQRSNNKGSSPS